MYILTDESLKDILGGEFYQVILAKKINPKISMLRLFKMQYKYHTYLGFMRFFKKILNPAIESITIVDNDTLKAKFIRWITRESR